MNELAQSIMKAATEKVRSHESRNRGAYEETVRRQRRTNRRLSNLVPEVPRYWRFDPSHDPYHVRARAKAIGHSIDNAIKNGTYRPFPPAGFSVSKPDGGRRTVTTFAIADEAVSKRLYQSLMNKNRARLSARSYAYRQDLGVHDAITHIQSEWMSEYRIYVAQYDFSDYFGSIDHSHIWTTIENLGLYVTRTERRLLRAFMEAPLPTPLPATMPTGLPKRTRGIPQGTTVSLFLANIAATPLDREFERLGVSFARYADDIVIWSRDYASLSRAVDELHRFAEKSKCSINQTKSEGVSLLTVPEVEQAEFRTIHHIDFLSQRIGLRSIAMSDRAYTHAKAVLSGYIYDHLLREPINGNQDMARLARGIDRDYLALLWQLRRYLYGSLSEEQLRRMLRGPLPPKISIGGLFGRHPLVNDSEQLRGLDAWLSTQVWLALRKRAKILQPALGSPPAPWGYPQDDLAQFMAHSRRHLRVDGRLPSAVRMAELVRRAVRAHGTRVATHSRSTYNWA